MVQAYSINATVAAGAMFPLSIVAIQKGVTATVNGNSIQLNRCGVYAVSVDMSLTPSAEGDVVIQLYKDGVAMPQAKATGTGATTTAANYSFGTLVQCDRNNTNCCCTSPVTLTLVNDSENSVTGDINVVVTKIC